MSAPESIVSSLSLFPAELVVLENRLEELQAVGINLRRARFIRALVHLTPEDEMFTCAKRLAETYVTKDGVRESDYVAARPEIELSTADVAKIDRVKKQLAREKILATATRAFIVRAVLHWAPSGAALASGMHKFLEDYPNKPRGLSKLRLAQRKRPHG